MMKIGCGQWTMDHGLWRNGRWASMCVLNREWYMQSADKNPFPLPFPFPPTPLYPLLAHTHKYSHAYMACMHTYMYSRPCLTPICIRRTGFRCWMQRGVRYTNDDRGFQLRWQGIAQSLPLCISLSTHTYLPTIGVHTQIFACTHGLHAHNMYSRPCLTPICIPRTGVSVLDAVWGSVEGGCENRVQQRWGATICVKRGQEVETGEGSRPVPAAKRFLRSDILLIVDF